MSTRHAASGEEEPVVWVQTPLGDTAAGVVAGLAGNYRVFVTAPSGGSFEEQASEVIAFIETLEFESVRLAGCGDGALVALLVALRRPRLVGRLVFVDQLVTVGSRGVDLGDLANLRPPTLLVAADRTSVPLESIAHLCREFFAA